jgi:hypothetical protein
MTLHCKARHLDWDRPISYVNLQSSYVNLQSYFGGCNISAQDKYFEAIQEGLGLGGYYAMWPAGRPVTLGAIGKLNGRVYDPRGHLRDYVAVEQDPTDDQPHELTYGHGHGIDVTFKVGGATGAITQALADVDLAVQLTFHARDQVALRAVGVRYPQVRDARKFSRSILANIGRAHLEYGDVFVTGMITADSGAAAVSAVAGAMIELTGKGDVSPGAAVTLASLKAGISIANSSDTSLLVPMKHGFVVAVRLVSLDKKGIFKKRPIIRDLTYTEDEFDREYLATFEDMPGDL